VTALAMAKERIRISAGVADLPLSLPSVLAKQGRRSRLLD